jgi:hypothetical protein
MVSRFNAVSKAAKHLHSQHGEVSALKLVAFELRKARRARSRERFIFGSRSRRNLQNRARRDSSQRRQATGERAQSWPDAIFGKSKEWPSRSVWAHERLILATRRISMRFDGIVREDLNR